MKKQSKVLTVFKYLFVFLLISPLFLSWCEKAIPAQWVVEHVPEAVFSDNGHANMEKETKRKIRDLVIQFNEESESDQTTTPELEAEKERIRKDVMESHYKTSYFRNLMISFQDLSKILIITLVCAMIISLLIGFLSVLWNGFGKFITTINNAIESIPSIFIALFCYIPVSGFMASGKGSGTDALSLVVFVAATTATVLPEAVRSISIPLSDLYNRKYSVSFRSYGFAKSRILAVLMRTGIMLDSIKRVAAGILLKTLILDTSFGYILQFGFGANGTPAHLSPGALIATYRSTLMFGGTGSPWLFWIPSILLIAITVAFFIVINDNRED